jgi:nucleoside-diphosphate-sugar epimerase
VEMLLKLGYKVRVLDNLSTGSIMYLPLDHENLEFIYGDITNKADVTKAMAGIEPQYLNTTVNFQVWRVFSTWQLRVK